MSSFTINNPPEPNAVGFFCPPPTWEFKNRGIIRFSCRDFCADRCGLIVDGKVATGQTRMPVPAEVVPGWSMQLAGSPWIRLSEVERSPDGLVGFTGTTFDPWKL